MKILRSALPFLSLAVVALAACERAKAPPPADSASVRPSGTADAPPPAAGRTWDVSAGPVLLVQADSAGRALVVVPDSASAPAEIGAIPHPASVTLFSRSGSVQLAELPSVTDTNGCAVAALSAAPPPHVWNVGFIGGVVAPLPVDTTASIAPADSAALVVWMNRLASALPNDPAGRFSGLPFVVNSLWRFTLPSGQQVAVGAVSRQLNQEATPLVEHTFLIAERPANDTTFSTAYSERSYGPEETIESRDILAGALLGASRNAALIIARDYGDAVAYSLLERDAAGKWTSQWTSARRHCAT